MTAALFVVQRAIAASLLLAQRTKERSGQAQGLDSKSPLAYRVLKASLAGHLIAGSP